jgi:hypothetical protein
MVFTISGVRPAVPMRPLFCGISAYVLQEVHAPRETPN